MRGHRNTARTGTAKVALILLGLVSCVGGAAFALAQAGRLPWSAADTAHAGRLPARSLSIHVAPLADTVAPGAAAEYTIRIRQRYVRIRGQDLRDRYPELAIHRHDLALRHRDRRRVRLTVSGGLPAGATASFSSSSTRDKRATLTIATGAAASGDHPLRIEARAGKRSVSATADLVIGPPADPPPASPPGSPPQPSNFTITGDLSSPLQPGRSVPLDLVLTNPGTVEITISSLDVDVESVDAPRADPTYPCGLEDFSVTEFSGTYGFTLPAGATRSLSELGIPAGRLPEVGMLNRPVNQNGCKGSSLQLAFAGTAVAP